MKEIQKEIKSYITKYEAFDGRLFDDKKECEKYENTANAVIMNEFFNHVIKTITEYELSPYWIGSEEYDIAVIDIKDENALEHVNRAIQLCNDKFKSNGHKLLNNEYIGKRILMSLGYRYSSYDGVYDNIGYVYGTLENVLFDINKHMMGVFGYDDAKNESM